MDYVEGDIDDDNNREEHIRIDEENATGLKIAQVISMEDQKENEPMEIEPDNFVPPIHHVDVLEKEIIIISSQATQGGNPTDQQKDVPPLDTAKEGTTPATLLKEKQTDNTPIPAPVPKLTPVEEITLEPVPPTPGPKPESSDITPEPQPPVPPEPKKLNWTKVKIYRIQIHKH